MIIERERERAWNPYPWTTIQRIDSMVTIGEGLVKQIKNIHDKDLKM
jgi:hypothetical protein